jgi:hypothetical protein
VSSAAQRIGLGTHHGVDERLEHRAQQVRLRMLEVFGQEPGRVNTVIRGYRFDLLQGDFEGSGGGRLTSRRHAQQRASSYTTSVDSTVAASGIPGILAASFILGG